MLSDYLAEDEGWKNAILWLNSLFKQGVIIKFYLLPHPCQVGLITCIKVSIDSFRNDFIEIEIFILVHLKKCITVTEVYFLSWLSSEITNQLK